MSYKHSQWSKIKKKVRFGKNFEKHNKYVYFFPNFKALFVVANAIRRGDRKWQIPIIIVRSV